jgi:hypothetical protein
MTTMNIEELVEGGEYKVNAPGTSTRERWTITKIKDNGEVEAKGSNTPHIRTFLPEVFYLDETQKKKAEKKMITESIEKVGELSDGTEMWIEKIIQMPAHKRRGRKPQS